MHYSDRLGISCHKAGLGLCGVCGPVVGGITEELECGVICTKHRGGFYALHSGRDVFATITIRKEDWVCSSACRGTQEAEMTDLRQVVKSSHGGSSDGWKTQKQITLGPKKVGGKEHWGECPHRSLYWAHFLSIHSEDAL